MTQKTHHSRLTKAAKEKRLTAALSAAEARKLATDGLASMTREAVQVLRDALSVGDTKTAQWVLAQVLDMESVATVAAAESKVALPTNTEARAQVLEGLRLIKQAERRTA